MKTPVLEFLLNKVANLQPATLLKRDFSTVAFLGIAFFIEHLWWLLSILEFKCAKDNPCSESVFAFIPSNVILH